jgi:hypothetical protein
LTLSILGILVCFPIFQLFCSLVLFLRKTAGTLLMQYGKINVFCFKISLCGWRLSSILF